MYHRIALGISLAFMLSHTACHHRTVSWPAQGPNAWAGWRIAAEQGAEPQPVDEARVAGERLVAPRGAGVRSPALPVDSLQYYRLKIQADHSAPTLLHVDNYDADGGFMTDHVATLINGDGSGQLHFTRTKLGANSIEVLMQPEASGAVELESFAMRPAARRSEVADWADSLYAEMPPLKWTAPLERWKHLETFQNKLLAGGVRRVVMLGDSIINDTGNSPMDVLIERHYPRLQLEVITSVANGKGCGYYRHENRVTEYVTRYQPELVIIGGISHGNDIEAIRDVIHQIRAENSADILLMTGAFGRGEDPRAIEGWQAELPDDSSHYRARLKGLAQAEGVGYFDLRGAWGGYFLGIEEPMEYFMRDNTHANVRGAQVLARLMERFFAPDSQ